MGVGYDIYILYTGIYTGIYIYISSDGEINVLLFMGSVMISIYRIYVYVCVLYIYVAYFVARSALHSGKKKKFIFFNSNIFSTHIFYILRLVIQTIFFLN